VEEITLLESFLIEALASSLKENDVLDVSVTEDIIILNDVYDIVFTLSPSIIDKAIVLGKNIMSEAAENNTFVSETSADEIEAGFKEICYQLRNDQIDLVEYDVLDVFVEDLIEDFEDLVDIPLIKDDIVSFLFYFVDDKPILEIYMMKYPSQSD
jgi:hypothetical protein